MVLECNLINDKVDVVHSSHALHGAAIFYLHWHIWPYAWRQRSRCSVASPPLPRQNHASHTFNTFLATAHTTPRTALLASAQSTTSCPQLFFRFRVNCETWTRPLKYCRPRPHLKRKKQVCCHFPWPLVGFPSYQTRKRKQSKLHSKPGLIEIKTQGTAVKCLRPDGSGEYEGYLTALLQFQGIIH